MKFCIFSSGSKQNCFYLESGKTALLIDMGISFRALNVMLRALGREVSDLGGVFISHEHSDHTRGLATLTKRAALPIYLHPASKARLGLPLTHARLLYPHIPVTLGDITILPFPVSHDAVNTFGFRITDGDRSLFLASDLGCFDEAITTRTIGSHAIAIESNYDQLALHTCGYPPSLKARIRGRSGHLSNDDAVRFLQQTIQPHTLTVFLLHLSANSNSPSHVQQQIDTHLAIQFPHVTFHISHRDQALPLIEI